MKTPASHLDRTYWTRLVRLALVALALGLLCAGATTLLLPGYLYAHGLTHPGCQETALTPAELSIANAEDVLYTSHDGLALHAWYVPPRNGAVIILMPGRGAARDGMLREARVLTVHGFGILATELRSCAHPRGQSTLGHREAADLTQAVGWLRGHPEVEHVGVLGFSVGGAAAILGAAQDERIEAVVAEGSYYNLGADITGADPDAPPWRRALHWVTLAFYHLETGVDARAVSPIAVVRRISPRPLLLIYGETEASSARAREQLAQAGEPKELWIVPSCGHGGYLNAAPQEWEQRVSGFFEQALMP